MKSIYKNKEGKKTIIKLYDKQLDRLNIPFNDLFIETSFGATHLIETGNLNEKPLLVFHGVNVTTACNLITSRFLLKKFHIYAVDTIGHPGKSAQVSISYKNYDYGKWVSEIISALRYKKMSCIGGSFGAGIIAKTMCVAPEKIEKAVLYFPAGIKNAPIINSIGMLFPMLMYNITKKEKWLVRCIKHMAVTKENIDNDTFETIKCNINNAKIINIMPSDVNPIEIKKCKAPTLVMAGENDCLFPADKVIPIAKKTIPDCTTYLMNNRGHMGRLNDIEKQKIVNFLL